MRVKKDLKVSHLIPSNKVEGLLSSRDLESHSF